MRFLGATHQCQGVLAVGFRGDRLKLLRFLALSLFGALMVRFLAPQLLPASGHASGFLNQRYLKPSTGCNMAQETPHMCIQTNQSIVEYHFC
jgi:hypothetical protein